MKPILAVAMLTAGLALSACERNAPADEIVNAVDAAEAEAANSMLNAAGSEPDSPRAQPNQPTGISIGPDGASVRTDNASVAVGPRTQAAAVTINKH